MNTEKAKRIVLAGIIVTEMFAAIEVTGMTVMIVALTKSFGIDKSFSGWILLSYLIPFCAGLLPFGYLADKIGRPEKIHRFSVLGFGLCSLFCALSFNIYWLLVFRCLKGLCAGGIFSSQLAMIIKFWDKPRQALEITLIGTAVGVILGPVIGGIFAGEDRWRFFFLIATAFSGVAFLIYHYLRYLPTITRKVVFAENTVSVKIKILQQFLWWPVILYFFTSFATMGANVLITLHLQAALNQTPLFNGLMLGLASLGMAVNGVFHFGSTLFRKIETAAWSAGLFLILCIVALPFTGWTGVLAFINYFILGIFVGITISTYEILACQHLPDQFLAQGAGYVTLAMQLGYAVSSLVVPLLYQTTGVFTLSWIVTGPLLFIILFFLKWGLTNNRC